MLIFNKKQTIDIAKLPKPSGDILFYADGANLQLEKLIPEGETVWLVAYSRMLERYNSMRGVMLSGSCIRMEDLMALGRLMDSDENLTRTRICLYFPVKKHCYYLKHQAYTGEGSGEIFAERPGYVLPVRNKSEDQNCKLTVYLSESGLLSFTKSGTFFKPRSSAYITSENITSDGTILLKDLVHTPDGAPVFFGLYCPSPRKLLVLMAEDGKISLPLIHELAGNDFPDPDSKYYLCLIDVYAQCTCSYLFVCASYNPDDKTSVVPLELEHQYDSLIAPPFSLPGGLDAVFRHEGRGRVYIDFLPSEERFKYHRILFQPELPDVNDEKVTARFDSEEEVTPDFFFDYLRRSQAVLECQQMVPADLLRVKKRILFNISKMLLAAVRTKGQYEAPYPVHEEIWPVLSRLLSEYDDDLILHTATSRYMKVFLLHEKYGHSHEIQERIDDVRLYCGDTLLYRISQVLLRLEIIELKDHMLTVEGCLRIPAAVSDANLVPVCYVNNVAADFKSVERYSDESVFGRSFQTMTGFSLSIPLEGERYKVTFGIRGYGMVPLCRNVEMTQIVPLSKAARNAYYYQDDYVVKFSKDSLLCLACDEEKREFYESLLCREIENRYGEDAERILALRKYYWDHKDDPEDVWLMIDRPDRADDNAEVLFRYVAGQDFDHVKPVFVLADTSPQFSELSEVGTVVDFRSEDHLKAFLRSKYIFSSQFAPSTMNPFNEDFNYFRDIVRQKKFVFLQHGVTKDDNGAAFSHYARDFYGIIVSGNEEYRYMCSQALHNDPETIWLTGLPRFDRVYDHNQRIITIMPTWRKYLTTRVYDEEQQTSIWKVKDDYMESEYFQFYNSLINDERLIKTVREKHYTIQLMPHVQFLKQADDFEIRYPDVVSLCHYDTRYCDVFSTSSLILTDFSSIGFDFGYLYKPVLYCQFDKEEFYRNHTMKPGYYDYETHGFGEVLYNLTDTIETLISYVENDCKMKDTYRQRVDAFFRYTDHRCCERICQRVFELEDR